MSNKMTIILDFDGVINSYESGWRGVTNIPDEPVEGVNEAIQELRKKFKVVVHSSRCHQKGGMDAIKDYLQKYNIEVDEVVENKVPAVVQVDDRAITFKGEWNKDLIDSIKNFKPWHK
jgi:phosphoglycolate phosphatase-like HAD superfamily hydrolase